MNEYLRIVNDWCDSHIRVGIKKSFHMVADVRTSNGLDRRGQHGDKSR